MRPDGTMTHHEPEPTRATFAVFLSHNSRDKSAVERLAERLKRAGVEPWLDKWCLTPGGDWQTELDAGVRASSAFAFFLGPHGQGDWARAELALAQDRAVKDRDGYRLFPVLLPGVPEPFDPSSLPPFLSLRTWVDLRGGIDATRGFQSLVCAIKGIPLGPSVPIAPNDEVCPYRGLQPFDEASTDFFFGRDGEIQRLVEKLKGTRFLAVLGPSGSGKSSLVQAGLLPALRQGVLPGSETWPIQILKPGERPLTELAAALTKLSPQATMASTLDGLLADQRTLDLTSALALAGRPADERIVWVIDQFEEVFTLQPHLPDGDDRERAAFLANLLYAATVPGGRTIVMLTMRADFLHQCAAYPTLAANLGAQQFLVSPMSRDDLRQTIVEPARQVGLELESGLAETILDDVADRPGSLPLLEHALLELWERRRAGLLTLEGYQESGGVEGAITQRAETVFEGLDASQQAIARRVLLRLTQPGEGTEDTRRRVTLGELLTRPEERDAVKAVVDTLASARLLTTDSPTGDLNGTIVDVAHEALIRGWPRLRGWLDEDRAALRVHRRLTEAAQEWERSGHDEGVLYRGARLAVAREWRQHRDAELNEQERAFLDASVALERREREERDRRHRNVLVGSMVAAVVGVALAIVAGWQWYRAEQQRQAAEAQSEIALAQLLGMQSGVVLGAQVDLALLLSTEAYDRHETPQTRASLVNAVSSSDGLLRMMSGHTDLIYKISFSPDGRLLASDSQDGTIRLWDTATGRPHGQPLDGGGGSIIGLSFSPDGQMLASGGADRMVRLWDVATGRPRGPPFVGHTDEVNSVRFSPDGQTLVSASDDGTIRLWDVATGQPRGDPLVGHTDAVDSVRFSPDGRTLASGGHDTTVRLWDVASGQQIGQPLTGHTGTVWTVAFSPDGQLLASGSDDKTIRLWDVATGEPHGDPLTSDTGEIYSVGFSSDGQTLISGSEDDSVRLWDVATGQPRGQPFTGHAGPVYSVEFSPDQHTIASGSEDQTVRLWDVTRDQPRRILDAARGEASGAAVGIDSVAFSPDGRTLATGGRDQTVQIWDAASGQPRGQPLNGHTGLVASLAFSPDGQTLASGSDDHTIRLWDVASGQPRGQPLTGHTGLVASLAFSPDGRTLASGGGDGAIRLWNVADGDTLGSPLMGHTDEVFALWFSPDGRTLASGSRDRTVRLWDVASRQPRGEPQITSAGQADRSMAFSPDGQLLATGGRDGLLRLWDIARDEPRGLPLRGHTWEIGAVAFSPDGQTLASGSDDWSVRLWDVATGQPRGQPFTGHAERVYSVAFSPDGRTLASASVDGTVRLWDVDMEPLPTIACRRANRNLTLTEWVHYLGDAPYQKTCPDLPGPDESPG